MTFKCISVLFLDLCCTKSVSDLEVLQQHKNLQFSIYF